MRPVVKHAIDAGLPLAVYGGDWAGLIPDSYVREEFMPHHDVGAEYRAAGVVLNDHWESMRVQGFISNRLFDAAASGARVVTDDIAGISDLFGRSVQIARSPADLVRLGASNDLDEIFGDDDERRGVAERVAKEHSFDARAQQLLEAALEVRQSR
jgi:spore maturation protein CgeB